MGAAWSSCTVSTDGIRYQWVKLIDGLKGGIGYSKLGKNVSKDRKQSPCTEGSRYDLSRECDIADATRAQSLAE